MVITAILVLLIVDLIVNLIYTIVGCAGVKRRIRGIKELVKSLEDTLQNIQTGVIVNRNRLDETAKESKSNWEGVTNLIKEALAPKPKAAPKKPSTPATPKAEKKTATPNSPKPAKKEEKKAPVKKEAVKKAADNKKVRK